MHKTFTIKCKHCGHVNKPHNSPTKGVERILRGEFTKCNHCNTELTKFFIPKRPMIARIAKEIPPVPGVALFEYKGRTPRGWAS
jgi:hypothetical protein